LLNIKNLYRTSPFFRYGLFLLLGTLIGFQYEQVYSNHIVIILLITLSIIILNYFIKQYLLSIFSVILIGFTNALIFQYNPNSVTEGKHQVVLEILNIDKQTKNTSTYKAKILFLKNNAKWESKQEKIILKTTNKSLFTKNDRILAQIDLKLISNYKSTPTFNRINYFKHKNIRFECFLNQNSFNKLPKNSSNPLISLKNTFIQKINLHIRDEKVNAFARSILFGDKSTLNYDMKKSFMYTGTAHILAISGLHVGILFLVLKLLFFPFFKLKKISFIGSGLVILTIILYAYLAENPVSAIRATIMLCLYLIAEIFRQKPLITNYLFCSVFLILLLQPGDIFNIGFYLSVGAVLSILMFYPLLPKLNTKYKFLQFIWELLMITIAVQPISGLLCAYFFGYFPTYFLISNILTILILYVFLFFSILFLATPLPFLHHFVDYFGNLIFKINTIIYQLPYSTISINWSVYGFCFFLFSVISFYLGITSRKLTWVNIALISFIAGNALEILK